MGKKMENAGNMEFKRFTAEDVDHLSNSASGKIIIKDQFLFFGTVIENNGTINCKYFQSHTLKKFIGTGTFYCEEIMVSEEVSHFFTREQYGKMIIRPFGDSVTDGE